MSEPLVLSVAECRRLDQAAIELLGVPGVLLMENAGRGAVDALLEFDPALRIGEPRVGIVCGGGNNAGDGFVVARRLKTLGIPVAIALTTAPDRFRGDAALNFAIAVRMGLAIADLSGCDPSDLDAFHAKLTTALGSCAWLVDALLGTGVVGAPRGLTAAAIRWINAQEARRIALDVPSGLDADAGIAHEPTVRAEFTCTFAALKRGFLNSAAADCLGAVRVVDIGVPSETIAASLRSGRA